MRRRALLASGAGLLSAGFAGCLGDTDDAGTGSAPTQTTTDPTTDESTTEQTSVFDATVDASVDRIQPSVAFMGIDSVGVVGDGNQYVFYEVEVTDVDPPERSAFGFRYGGRVVSPGVETGSGATLWRASESSDRYTADRGAGWLVFELPAEIAAEHAGLTLGSQEWPVAGAVRDRLENPAPELSLDWQVPEGQPAGTSTIGFEVTNDGDRDTRFVGGVNAVDIRVAYAPVAVENREIPAGETVAWEITHDNGREPGEESVGDGEPDGEYRLDWTQGERVQTVRFVAPEQS